MGAEGAAAGGRLTAVPGARDTCPGRPGGLHARGAPDVEADAGRRPERPIRRVRGGPPGRPGHPNAAPARLRRAVVATTGGPSRDARGTRKTRCATPPALPGADSSHCPHHLTKKEYRHETA